MEDRDVLDGLLVVALSAMVYWHFVEAVPYDALTAVLDVIRNLDVRVKLVFLAAVGFVLLFFVAVHAPRQAADER